MVKGWFLLTSFSSDIDFQGLRLNGLDLSGLQFEQENFHRSRLNNVSFVSAQLSTAIFNNVRSPSFLYHHTHRERV
jgi:uncharacterized protein YjbI with pentapeptide repeats